MNNLLYFIIALGMTPEQRNQILKDIDLTTPEGFNELHDKVIDYINETIVTNYTGVSKAQINDSIKNTLNILWVKHLNIKIHTITSTIIKNYQRTD